MTAIQRTVLKHPGSAYLIVAFFALCATVVVRHPLEALVYLVPLAGGFYVYRTATVVDETGLTARALLGSQTVTWTELRGLRLLDSGAVYAVAADDTQLRLPCVRSTKLQPLIVAGAGRIPDPAAAAAAEADGKPTTKTEPKPAAAEPAVAAEPASEAPEGVQPTLAEPAVASERDPQDAP